MDVEVSYEDHGTTKKKRIKNGSKSGKKKNGKRERRERIRKSSSWTETNLSSWLPVTLIFVSDLALSIKSGKWMFSKESEMCISHRLSPLPHHCEIHERHLRF
ncbi:hypothetical protein CDAR_619431 [Caerostris darwini]|uniref:Uncharacterized protein n=1 Tax=Caerostris darwini TaxID=1538125 RepID=A0AAV4PWK6_9ARAC|nr:hypothetical protein CDAR_619431 [Caerostris darwini]